MVKQAAAHLATTLRTLLLCRGQDGAKSCSCLHCSTRRSTRSDVRKGPWVWPSPGTCSRMQGSCSTAATAHLLPLVEETGAARAAGAGLERVHAFSAAARELDEASRDMVEDDMGAAIGAV